MCSQVAPDNPTKIRMRFSTQSAGEGRSWRTLGLLTQNLVSHCLCHGNLRSSKFYFPSHSPIMLCLRKTPYTGTSKMILLTLQQKDFDFTANYCLHETCTSLLALESLKVLVDNSDSHKVSGVMCQAALNQLQLPNVGHHATF